MTAAAILIAVAASGAIAFGSLIYWIDRKIEAATELRENIRARLEIE